VQQRRSPLYSTAVFSGGFTVNFIGISNQTERPVTTPRAEYDAVAAGEREEQAIGGETGREK